MAFLAATVDQPIHNLQHTIQKDQRKFMWGLAFKEWQNSEYCEAVNS